MDIASQQDGFLDAITSFTFREIELTWSHYGDVSMTVVRPVQRAAERVQRVFDGASWDGVLRGPVQTVVVRRLAVLSREVPVGGPWQALQPRTDALSLWFDLRPLERNKTTDADSQT